MAAFGLRNAVFALGDTFLEVVSPVQPDAAAGRWLERRGGDCGYMAMFEIDDLAAARHRAGELGLREVFEIDLPDMAEVHLHPTDVGGAIVALSRPRPAGSWRWGGPDWRRRSSPERLAGITVSVPDPEATARRWGTVLGAEDPGRLGVRFETGDGNAGIVEIALAGPRDATVDLGRIRVSCATRADLAAGGA